MSGQPRIEFHVYPDRSVGHMNFTLYDSDGNPTTWGANVSGNGRDNTNGLIFGGINNNDGIIQREDHYLVKNHITRSIPITIEQHNDLLKNLESMEGRLYDYRIFSAIDGAQICATFANEIYKATGHPGNVGHLFSIEDSGFFNSKIWISIPGFKDYFINSGILNNTILLSSLINNIINSSEPLYKPLIPNTEKEIGDITDIFDNNISLLDNISDIISNLIDGIKNILNNISSVPENLLDTLLDTLLDVLKNTLNSAMDIIISNMDSAGDSINGAWDRLFDTLLGLFNPQPTDPIIIDIDGDGIKLISLDASKAFFDLDGDGFAERTGWISPDDAFLVFDANENGKIDDISELFGSESMSGYKELISYDINKDRIIDKNDAIFDKLSLWFDKNSNGINDDGEIFSLEDYDIKSISLNSEHIGKNVSGNIILEQSDVYFENGNTVKSAEVIFSLSQRESFFNISENFSYNINVVKYPLLYGMGEIPNLWISMSLDNNLMVDVEEILDNINNNEFEYIINNLSNDFDNLMFKWANVEDSDWYQNISNIEIRFAYDKDEIERIYSRIDLGHGVDLPKSQWKIFFPEKYNEHSSDLNKWMQDNNLVFLPDMDTFILKLPSRAFMNVTKDNYYFNNNPLELGPSFLEDRDYVYLVEVYGSKNYPIYAVQNESGVEIPNIDSRKFSFIQKIMGQKLSRDNSYFSPDNLILSLPDYEQSNILSNSYEDLRKYFLSKFIVQSIKEDSSIYEIFNNLRYVYDKDIIIGNYRKFTIESVERLLENNFSYENILKFISMFSIENPYIGLFVVENFKNINKELIYEHFNIENIVDGSNENDDIKLTSTGSVLARDGDDRIIGSSRNDIFLGGRGNDTLHGGEGNDTYVYSRGDGHDVIVELIHGGTQDRLVFTDVNPGDVTLTRNGAHVTLVIAESAPGAGDGGSVDLRDSLDDAYGRGLDSILFADGSVWTRADLRLPLLAAASTPGDDLVIGFNVADLIDAGAGNDVVHSHAGDDRITGGLGNDTLHGGEGNDTYVYSRGDGHDVIVELIHGGTQDRLVFTDVNPGDVTLTRNGAHVTLVIAESAPGAGDGGSVDLRDSLDDAYGRGLDSILFADGSVWTRAALRANIEYLGGTRGDDTIRGTLGNDEIFAGTGNDTLIGNGGSDTFVFHSGFGRDTITDLSTIESSGDILAFNVSLFVNFEAVSKSTMQIGHDTVIKYDDDNTLTLKNVMMSSLQESDFLFII